MTNNPKIAVVTGGSSGIGRHAAVRIAERGDGVILTYNSSAAGAQETVATIERGGGTAVALELDLGASETFGGFAQNVAAELSGAGVDPLARSARASATVLAATSCVRISGT